MCGDFCAGMEDKLCNNKFSMTDMKGAQKNCSIYGIIKQTASEIGCFFVLFFLPSLELPYRVESKLEKTSVSLLFLPPWLTARLPFKGFWVGETRADGKNLIVTLH